MSPVRMALLFGAMVFASAAADAQTSMRVRGTIIALNGNVLAVKTREGQNLNIELAADASVTAVKALTLADIKPGSGIGSSAVTRADGVLVAREVHVFPAERGVPNEGHRPWDLEPGATMTNAAVASMVQAADGRVLTLTYKGGMKKLLVPEGVPVVTAIAADRASLIPGEYVYLAAETGADGRITTSRVQVSKDGVKPPQ